MKHPNFSPSLLAIVAAILFGISTPFSKVLLGDMDSIVLAACLYLGSGLGAAIFLVFSAQIHWPSQEAKLNQGDMGWMLGSVLSGGVAAPIVLLFGLKITPASTASLLLNFEGIATTLIAALVFKEAVGKRIIAAMGLMTLASVLISWTGNQGWGVSLGMLGIIAACIFWGIDNNLTRNISAKNPLMIVMIKGLGAGIFSLILSLLLGRTLPDIGHFFLALALGFISYGMSIALFIRALRGLGTARTSTLFSAAPFIGALASLLFLHETPQGLFFAAALLMLLGAWLMLSENHSHRHFHLPESHEHRHSHPDPHHEHLHPDQPVFTGEHSHWHEHSPLEHDHTHTPDTHHRHSHDH